jgi:adenylate cyclase
MQSGQPRYQEIGLVDTIVDMTTAHPSPEPAGGWRLSWDELTARTGATLERLQHLVELGILAPADTEEPFGSGDILRVRAVATLEGSGVRAEQIAAAIAAGELSFGYLDYVIQPPTVVDRTYSQAAEDLAVPFDVIERAFLAFGLPQPLPEEPAREDDMAILRGLKALLEAMDEADVLDSARIFGDALRRLAEYQLHLFHTRVEERFRNAGVPEALVLDVALKEVGVHTSPLGELFAAWLYRRHSETFTIEHRVLHAEDDLERAGIHRRAATDPPAIVFLDISGYTHLTEELGDAASAAMPMRLAGLVQDAASRYNGRTLKWIGDGVELYFRRPVDAVRCSLELHDRIPEADLPGTHVGINAGPVVYENGDFYGRTVNIAARIAAYAALGQVLVSEDVVSHGASDDIRFRRIGPVPFKGVSRDVVVYEAERA